MATKRRSLTTTIQLTRGTRARASERRYEKALHSIGLDGSPAFDCRRR